MRTHITFLVYMIVAAIILIAGFMVLAVVFGPGNQNSSGFLRGIIIASLAFLVFSAPYFVAIFELHRLRTGFACGLMRGTSIFVIVVSTPISLVVTILSGFAGSQAAFISALRMDGVWILFNLVNIPIFVSSIRQLRRRNDRSSAGKGTAFAVGYGIAIFVGFQVLFALNAPK